MRDFHFPGRSPVLATNGMCATSHPLGAKAAIDVLERGGNAMDAAIAGAVLLGICEPQMTGIGGDCFVLWSEGGSDKVHALNGSGRAPAALDAAMLRDAGEKAVPLRSAHAVTIPGAVDAFCHLSETVGKLGLDAVLASAIHYAEEGVVVAPRVAFDWDKDADTLQGVARTHFLMDGKAPQAGDIFRAPGQAEVLRRIAKDGRDAFYTGEIADDMLAALNAAGGVHTAEDFAAVACTPTTPISGTYKDIEVVMDTAKRLAALIDPARAMQSPAALTEAVHKDTIYITVVDGDGMSVSLIYSVFHGFGSGIGTDKFGLLMQNRGAGFTLEEGHPNEMKGGKRPMHTIIPGMIRQNGRIVMPFGVMGGAYQSTGHARFGTNIADFGMDPQTAIDAPRAFTDNGTLNVERGYSDAIRATLSDMGHTVAIPATAIGGAQAIKIHDSGVLEGASDPRKDGCALGY